MDGDWVSGERARIKAQQDLTSSTLEWVDVRPGQPLPPHALVTDESGGAWCRISQHGHKVSGAVQEGKCHVPFMNRVKTSDTYEVLVSINDSARVLEVVWSRFSATPLNGIMVSKDILVGLARTEDGSLLAGHVNIGQRKANVLNGSMVEQLDDAFILTEEEPQSYELDSVQWDEAQRKFTSEDKVVANLTLENPASESKKVTEMVDYEVPEVYSWGTIQGMVVSQPTIVTGPGGEKREIPWGMRSTFARMEQQLVTLQLPAGTSVDVNLVGVMHKYEVPYMGRLTAVYSDGVRRARTISGRHTNYYLAELRAEYGRPRSLADWKELEGEFPTSEVLVASTTTTTTTTTTTPAPDPANTSPAQQQMGTQTTPSASPAPPPGTLPLSLLTCCLCLLMIYPLH